jgi:GTP-binding protein
VVRDRDAGLLLGELVVHGQRLTVAQGGRGGRGNAAFATSTRRAPRMAEPGAPGEERRLALELKLLADVGVVGFPNAGKSTLVSRLSAARPKVADYPFTTLVPTLGLVRLDADRSFVIADIPGLIPGAAEGRGLGLRFLRHVERTRALVHLVDLDPATGRDPAEDWHRIQHELEAYSPELAGRPQVLAANKVDLPGGGPRRRRGDLGRRRGLPVVPISARTGDGLAELRAAIAALLDASPGDRRARALG